MPNVIVAGKLHQSGRALLDSAPGLTVRYIDEISEESYASHVHEADALLIRTQPMTAPTINKADRLKIVSRHGVGYDAVDVYELTKRDIALAICGDVNSYSVAEHGCMMILAASKRALRGDASVRSGPWDWRNSLESQDLRGRNFLIMGFGRIGRHMAEMMSGFGLHIRAYDPFLQSQGWPEGPVSPAEDLRQALAWADIISVSAPKAKKPLITSAEFKMMKDGVIVVNTARGGIIDESALFDALSSGKVGAAGLDVFEHEPPAADNQLNQFDQVIFSPHIAGVTEGASERMALGSAQNIIDFFKGQINPTLVVNFHEIDQAIPGRVRL